MMTTNGEQSLLFAENIRVLEPIRGPKALGAIPAAAIVGTVIEVHVVKIPESMDLKVSIPSICKLGVQLT